MMQGKVAALDDCCPLNQYSIFYHTVLLSIFCGFINVA